MGSMASSDCNRSVVLWRDTTLYLHHSGTTRYYMGEHDAISSIRHEKGRQERQHKRKSTLACLWAMDNLILYFVFGFAPVVAGASFIVISVNYCTGNWAW